MNKSKTTKATEKIINVAVGKDILELLAGAMYVNPLNIFREYIQNSTDAIDEAIQKGIIKSRSGEIQINFDHNARSIIIRDNGIGISSKEFIPLLTNIGASHKRGTTLRGFRGVGRLSGLGYCQELIFRSHSLDEQYVNEIRWDGRKLKKYLNDPSFQGGLPEIIQSIVTFSELSSEGFPAHFFEVEMQKVSRLKNDLLLNEASVQDYLAQISPVPFAEDLSFKSDITTFLEKHGIKNPINILMNGDDKPIYHNLHDNFIGKSKLLEKVYQIEYVEILGFDGELAAIGWVADHAYSGAIPRSSGLGGIRLRSGNIQIGDEAILAELFPETRFSNWAIGEFHVISPKVLPNGRRDNFEASIHYSHIQDELAIHTKKISHQIRSKSVQRNQINDIEKQRQVIQNWVDLLLESKLPAFLLGIASNMAYDLSNKSLDNVEKTKKATHHDIKQYEKALALEVQLQTLNKDLNELKPRLKKSSTTHIPIEDVTKLILENSKDINEGLSLALKVLRC